MKICPQCTSVWPFALVLFMSTLVAFVTWLVISFAGADPLQSAIATLLAFVAVGGTMLHYVIACMQRHCHHGGQHSVQGPQHQGAMH